MTLSAARAHRFHFFIVLFHLLTIPLGNPLLGKVDKRFFPRNGSPGEFLDAHVKPASFQFSSRGF